MCYASSGPGGKHLTVEECKRAIDRLVEVEGRPEVLQLSGGEPTVHPQFLEIFEYACSQPIDIVMINSNGLRFARDPQFLERLAQYREKLEIYLQFDGFGDEIYQKLRGEPLAEVKLQAVEALGAAGIRVTLVTTLQPGVNEHQIGDIVKYGLERRWVSSVSFQPATYSGRHELPEDLERRITFPDVIRAIVQQTDDLFQQDDFMPLPCAHPNCHSLAYVYRADGRRVPLSRLVDMRKHADLFSGGILFTKQRVRQIISQYLSKLACCPDGSCFGPETPAETTTPAATSFTLPVVEAPPVGPYAELAEEFVTKAVSEQLTAADMFRITITSFLDAYNFDVRRVMKCCIHHVLPSGHLIPFCAYNVLYRDGHVPLPALNLPQAVGAKE